MAGTEFKTDTWTGCYPSHWQGVILTEAMSHPAKFSSRLIRRIYEHMNTEGWLHPGDTVLDPFGGVALGALDAMRLDLHWRGVELEPRFVELGGESYHCQGISRDFWRDYHHRPGAIAAFRAVRNLCPGCEAAMTPKTIRDKKTGQVIDRRIPEQLPHMYRGNIPLWMDKFGKMPNWGDAILFQGDSRKLLEVVSKGDVSVSSPPWQNVLDDALLKQTDRRDLADRMGVSNSEHVSPIDLEKIGKRVRRSYHGDRVQGVVGSPPYAEKRLGPSGIDVSKSEFHFGPNSEAKRKGNGYQGAIASPPYSEARIGQISGQEHCGRGDQYGNSQAQLGAMKASQEGFDAVIGSPPFRQQSGGTGVSEGMDPGVAVRHAAGNSASKAYGATDGQLANLKDGDFEAALSSPPWGEIQEGQGIAAALRGEATDSVLPNNHSGSNQGYQAVASSPPYDQSDQNYRDGWERFHKNHEHRFATDRQREAEYGETEGQLARADDFWTAARAIVEQVYLVLAPGGHAAWVCKDFVKDKQVVPFCDQWRQLCESVGFVTLHEHRALLVRHKGTSLTLEGGQVEHVVESKSFFRRLAEAKGSPRIDYEVVWCMVKLG